MPSLIKGWRGSLQFWVSTPYCWVHLIRKMLQLTTDDERKALSIVTKKKNSQFREERRVTSMSPMADIENHFDSARHLQKNVIVKQYIVDLAVRSPSLTFKK